MEIKKGYEDHWDHGDPRGISGGQKRLWVPKGLAGSKGEVWNHKICMRAMSAILHVKLH